MCQVCQGCTMLLTTDVSAIRMCQGLWGISEVFQGGTPTNRNDERVSNRMNRSDFLAAA